jgi:hypothetical protein
MLEKGRWSGPAQKIVCQESRAIIWASHLNRLLRCAKEKLAASIHERVSTTCDVCANLDP